MASFGNHAVIVGVDEAGRGPLAGPVVAGACVIGCELFRRRRSFPAWSPHRRIPKRDCLIADSKALTEDLREAAYGWITEYCAFGVGMVAAEEIDRIGILGATERAMQLAVAMVAERVAPTCLLVDGRDAFWFDYPHISIVRGDRTEPCIAAASIVAKVTRDRWMIEAGRTFPHFAFERHKGYATDLHVRALKEHGPCPLHRRSFLRWLADGAAPADADEDLTPASAAAPTTTATRR